MGVTNLPKIVTRQCRGCDLNPGPSTPESSTITTRLPSHPANKEWVLADFAPGFYAARIDFMITAI